MASAFCGIMAVSRPRTQNSAKSFEAETADLKFNVNLEVAVEEEVHWHVEKVTYGGGAYDFFITYQRETPKMPSKRTQEGNMR